MFLSILLRLAISLAGLGIVAYVLQGIDLARTGEALVEANRSYLGLGLLLIAASVFIRTLRWRHMLSPHKLLPLQTLLGPLLIGYAIGNITATGIGAIPRSMIVARREGMSTPCVLGTVLLEFILDAAVVVSWAAVVSFFLALPEVLAPIRYLLALMALGILLVILAFRRRKSLLAQVLPLSRLAAPLARRLPGEIQGGWEDFLEGASTFLNRGPTLVRVGVLTLGVWVVESLLFWVLMLAVGLEAGLPEGSAVMAFTHVVIGIPSLPGFVGTLDAAALASLGTLGLEGAQALSYTLVVHAYHIVPLTVVGALFAWREGIGPNWGRGEPR